MTRTSTSLCMEENASSHALRFRWRSISVRTLKGIKAVALYSQIETVLGKQACPAFFYFPVHGSKLVGKYPLNLGGDYSKLRLYYS